MSEHLYNESGDFYGPTNAIAKEARITYFQAPTLAKTSSFNPWLSTTCALVFTSINLFPVIGK